PALSGVPSFSGSGLPPHDAKTWFGAFAPAGTPKSRVEELARYLAAVIKSQTFQERFIKLGGYDAVGNTPEAFRNFLAEDRLRGQELVRNAGGKIAQGPRLE